MTIHDMLSDVKRLRPSEYEDAILLRWLNECEWGVYNEIILTHEGAGAFTGYDSKTPRTTVLLAPDAYCALYRHYLCARIDEANGETVRYNNDAQQYNTAYLAFMDYYNRHNIPLQKAAFVKVV